MFILSQITYAQITFDADFESGNLKSVTTSDSITYYVETNSDIGGRWFYFRINGVKNKNIRVELITSPADFTRAMYSFDDRSYTRFTENESPGVGIFQKQFEQDTVYVAYYTPYTYQMMQNNLNDWKKNDFVSLDTLGYSPNLFPMQEMIITDPSVPDSEKRSIWIHARTHPGETPTSWHFEGIVNELLSGNEVINHYLTKLKFHMIPFVNPDGVFYGNSRTNANYIDLEREWDKPDNETSMEVRILKARMKELNDEKPVSVFLNLHSQASSYCTFWIHYENGTSAEFFKEEMKFSYLNVSDNPYFTPNDFSFSTLKDYFPEGWLWNNYGKEVMALTYETPYDYYHNNSDSAWVTNMNLIALGRRTVYAIAEYLEISHPHHYILDNKVARFAGEAHSTYTTTNEYYGEDFDVLEPNKVSYAVLETEILSSGKYDVAGWWTTSEGNSFETKFTIITEDSTYEVTKTQKVNGAQWNYLTSITLNKNESVAIKLSSNSTGLVVADAFRLVYNGPVTSVEQQPVMPSDIVLYQNYPNPFNPSTIIEYEIKSNHSASENVLLKVYDILGREITTLVDSEQLPGHYNETFNSNGLASGTYIYILKVGDFMKTKKMQLIK
jgi:hypothetical protein